MQHYRTLRHGFHVFVVRATYPSAVIQYAVPFSSLRPWMSRLCNLIGNLVQTDMLPRHCDGQYPVEWDCVTFNMLYFKLLSVNVLKFNMIPPRTDNAGRTNLLAYIMLYVDIMRLWGGKWHVSVVQASMSYICPVSSNSVGNEGRRESSLRKDNQLQSLELTCAISPLRIQIGHKQTQWQTVSI